MRRAFTALATAMLLVAVLPSSASAARVTRFSDHHVGVFCETPVEGGYLIAVIDSSSEFGDFAQILLWLDPAIPFESLPSAAGETQTVVVVEGEGALTASASMTVVDPEGTEIGSGSIEASLTAVGEPHGPDQLLPGNHKSWTELTRQDYEGTGTVTVGNVAYEVACSGDVTDISVHENNPTSSVFNNEGIRLTCIWEEGDFVVALSASTSLFGSSADLFYGTATAEAFGFTDAVTLDADSFAADFVLEDGLGGDPIDATASAELTPIGDVITAFLDQQNVHVKSIQQALSVSGSLELMGVMTLAMDDEHCDAVAFDDHGVATSPRGTKGGGKVPANDAPDNAIAVEPGTTLNTITTGATLEPEVPNETCPEGFGDQMGNTVWYSVTGTGEPITVDTTGSDFDTMVAVYRVDGDSLVEVACDDDVFDGGIGLSYQAVVTFATDAGETYLIQVGGYRRFFDEFAQSGRLRLSIR